MNPDNLLKLATFFNKYAQQMPLEAFHQEMQDYFQKFVTDVYNKAINAPGAPEGSIDITVLPTYKHNPNQQPVAGGTVTSSDQDTATWAQSVLAKAKPVYQRVLVETAKKHNVSPQVVGGPVDLEWKANYQA